MNRRDYKGSTPFSDAELAQLNNGTDSQRADFLTARGVELGVFIDQFIQQNSLPLPSTDGSTGGVAILGWSVGNVVTLSSIANFKALSSEAQSRLATYIRLLVMNG